MDYQPVKPEDITGLELQVRKVHIVRDSPGEPLREDRTTEHIRLGSVDLRVWALLQALPKVSWDRLVAGCADPETLATDPATAQRSVDQAIAALLHHGLVDPQRIEKDGLDRGGYTQRMLATIAVDCEASEVERAEEAAALERRLSRLRAKGKKGEIHAEAGLEVPND